ncbi:hypothetical protein Tco_0118053 [Tanacetum coccineum]
MVFEVGDRVMLKGLTLERSRYGFGKRGSDQRYVGPFKVLAKVGKVAYRRELPQELSRVQHTFHVSNLKKCYTDEPLVMPLEGIRVDDKLQFMEDPVEIVEREIKRLKRSRITIAEYGVSTSIGYGVSNFLSNTAYSLKLINTAYLLPLDTAYRSSDKNLFLRMTKVIKGEFEKIIDVKVEDVSLTCNTQLEVFNKEVSRLNGMDNDSKQEADDDMGYDPSDVAFIEWLRSKFFNYKTMDHYTMKALWIYWIRGDDEVELTDEESSDDEDEVAEVFRIDTNLFNFETPMCKAFKEFNYLLQIDPDLLTKDIEGFKTYDDYKNDWIYE